MATLLLITSFLAFQIFLEDVNASQSRRVIGTSILCNPNPCQNNGHCYISERQEKCDCNNTTFTGDRCSSNATSYNFIRGYIVQDRRITHSYSEVLAVGIITRNSSASIIQIRTLSRRKYIRLQIIGEFIEVVYNFGTMDIRTVEDRVRVSDGAYHRIRFWRKGRSISLQVDNFTPVTNTHNSRQIPKSLDNVSKLIIGGIPTQTLIKAQFHGIMQGMTFNESPILSIAYLIKGLSSQVVGDVKIVYKGFGVHEAGEIKSTYKKNAQAMFPVTTTTTTQKPREWPFGCMNNCSSKNAKKEVIKPIKEPLENPVYYPKDDGIMLRDRGTDSLRSGNPMDNRKDIRLSTTTAGMVLGILVSIIIAVLILIYSIYKYKHKDHTIYLDKNAYESTERIQAGVTHISYGSMSDPCKNRDEWYV